jgi:class 3 adenylate cyclase
VSTIRYAQSGDRYLAYRVEGDGPVDLLICDEITMVSIDSIPDEPHWERFHQRLAAFSRLITFDRTGRGLSDGPTPGTAVSLECWAKDAVAVLDAVGSRQAVVFGVCGGGIALSLWSMAPERVSHLVLFNAVAHSEPASAEPWLRDFEKWLTATTDAERTPEVIDDVAYLLPSLADDPTFRRWWEQAGQRGASPKVAAEQNRVVLDFDLRPVLRTIDVPTLVMCRTDTGLGSPAQSRTLASRIPGAQLVELPGADYFPFGGDAAAVADEIEEFLTGSRTTYPGQRALTTILFSDIVGSTAQATRLGDQEWRARLDLHDAATRRQLRRFGGHELNTTGDGFIATFDTPSRAIQCGLAIRSAAQEAGVEVRVGIHSGEVEIRGDDIGGIAVHIGARVLAAAEPSSVFVSSTVQGLVTGSDLRFRDRGMHELKGVPGPWQLFEVIE